MDIQSPLPPVKLTVSAETEVMQTFMHDTDILISNITDVDNKLNYLDRGLLAANRLHQLNYFYLNETISRNKPLDLKLPNEFALNNSHNQILTLIAFGITGILMIIIYAKFIIYLYHKLSGRSISARSSERIVIPRDSRVETSYF